MKTLFAVGFIAFTVVPAAAEESLLQMLKQPSSPALAAVLAGDAPDIAGLESYDSPASVHRATRGIAALPVTVTTVKVARGREIDFLTYLTRE